jgi:outer membrane receptor protein involved in Fe transport
MNRIASLNLMKPNLKPTHLALAVAIAALHIGAAHAQTATPATTAATAAEQQADPLKLEQVVVTGTATRTSKMKQSLSVSTLDSTQLERTGATSAAELLRAIPGVRSESSGGEGNANITVRGVPLSAGGSRYVQMQEDGLPVLMFGDIAFGTADQFLRSDFNVDRLEVVRGGSASTLATNSPGGIVNFISKTGKEAGGNIGLNVGLVRKELRLDADYGGKIGAATTFHIGGFQRVGDGGRPAEFNSANGGQIKANITQGLDNGYVRLSFKSLDDRTPSFLPVPVSTVGGTINTIPGIDPRTAFFITPSLQRDVGLNRDNGTTTSSTRDGLHVKSTAVGLEAQLKLGEGWTLDEKFRRSSNSGRFIALFPANNGGNSAFFDGVLFNTSLDNMSNLFNDIKLSKALDVNGGKVTVSAGMFNGIQDVAQTWFWNTYRMQLVGQNAQVVNAAGAPSAAPVTPGYQTFGGCCVRSWDVQYTQTAPYAALAWEAGPLNIDASIRRDGQKANGYALQDSAANDGKQANIPGFDPATQQKVNYSVSHTSYSVGANYALNSNLAAFARISDGVSFSADRLLYGNPLDGSTPISLNKVQQTEAGVKWRNGAGVSVFGTLFNAKTNESNYEVTTQTFTSNKYNATGLELEAALHRGDFHLNAGATFTRARISASNAASQVGNKPRRQADLVWQLAPSFTFGPVDVGASIVGTTKSFGDDDNKITMPGYTVINAFANYQISSTAQLGLGVNNLANTLGYTEVEGDGHAARAVNGRSVRATLKYSF